MKTLLLAATVLSLGFGVARAETAQIVMHDTMMQHDTMHDGNNTAMHDTMAPKQAARSVTTAWQSYTGLAGGGG